MESKLPEKQNELFPIFLKLEKLQVLLVGAGNVGLEKLHSLLQNSPKANIVIVATQVHSQIEMLVKGKNCKIFRREFKITDLENKDLVILATNDPVLNYNVRNIANERGLFVNVADTPALCDFYLGSIVQKGFVKIAISTDGKSPTIAKRLKEVLHEAIPNEISNVAENISVIRKKLNGNFQSKVLQLNALTNVMVEKEQSESKKWKKVASYIVASFALMLVGHFLLSYLPLSKLVDESVNLFQSTDKLFLIMILAGFAAQMVDGATSMGYGVTSAIVLMSANISPAAISSSIHTAEIFASGASGYSHYKFGNVNMKMFKALVIPGVIGAVLGAVILVSYGETHISYVRPLMASYTLILGIKILIIAFRKNTIRKKFKQYGWLAGAGGFLDSFGGGGWGPIVTSTLLTKGRTTRYVVGSVSLTEFFVTIASAVTFFIFLGVQHWKVITGLIIGGLLAAPIAAKISGKLPKKASFILLGTIVIAWSLRILIKTF